MTTQTQPRRYVKPGNPNSVVTVKPRYENFIGGRWVPPVHGEYSTNLSPTTGQAFTQIPRSTAEDEEIFGPVLALTTFKDEREALEMANDTLYGLGAGPIATISIRLMPPLVGIRSQVLDERIIT